MGYKDSSFEIVHKKHTSLKLYAFVVSLLIGLKFTQLIPFLSSFSYAMLFASCIVSMSIFVLDKRNRIAFLPLFFLIVGALSLVVNPIQAEYRPVERYVFFLIMFIGIGPLLQSPKVNDFRFLVFSYLQPILVIITIGSFASFLFRLPFAFGNAGFKGLTPHSMDLSPVAALASLSLIEKLKTRRTIKQRIWMILLLVLSVITMIMAASRGAIIGFLAAGIVVLYAGSKKKVGHMLRTLLIVSIVLSVIIYINPFSMMDGLEAKMNRTEMNGDFSAGRNSKFELRFKEFEENPVVGIGFSSMKYTQPGPDGHFEPGSGWVFILSSMGMLGFIFAFGMCAQSIINSFTIPKFALLSAVILFFVIHSLIEGYILTVSNGLCLYMWLAVGLGLDKRYLAHYV